MKLVLRRSALNDDGIAIKGSSKPVRNEANAVVIADRTVLESLGWTPMPTGDGMNAPGTSGVFALPCYTTQSQDAAISAILAKISAKK